MKYANPEKTTVIAQHPVTGQTWTVPEGHRFWHEWGIDQAKLEGRIDEPDPVMEPGGGSGV
ncbi:hypothetical protein SD340_001116 [Vibrio fluvialis]|nr:hypothetical protein [Vibrio fluvialis]ELU8399301.1 hypothetical protein [Vibrio fluvialis]